MSKFLLSAMLILSSTLLEAKNIYPKKVAEFAKTSVRIYDKQQRSGGTGSIFRSYKNASHILTNKHVCRLIEQGGLVEQNGKVYQITHYKKFPIHDLCLVRVRHNFNVSTSVSERLARTSDLSYVSGHPSLLPHILTKGHLSSNEDIQLVVGIKKCQEEDTSFECAWFGGLPDVQTFDSKVVSNLIKPGSSGSAVFNSKGSLVGVAFAGDGRNFSHGFIVPHIYVIFFLQNAHRYKWVKVGTKVDSEDYIDRIFNYNKCRLAFVKDSTKYNKIKKFCKTVQDNVIWREQ